ncbi:hypothetical protein ATE84_0712 [Aquimarina sp. MAR_2010_214]|uniref:hypothetical protein n=1 Tax=Aquimarina sp. MAR_2010_214 TaxID=1250026 RepID=UPI000C6FE58E|nr:hypothetical protein [Aquimarina sp. MAR_2010_214]PKV48706.1 hypothetical protein ATE84_0712 [Aquimarina sp. MAR_2010_214]
MSITSRISYIILICFIIYSCNNSKKKANDSKEDKYKIISLLIEKLSAGPPPPPPPPGVYKKDTIAFNRYVDSINKLNVSIVVFDHFIESERTFTQAKREIHKDFHLLIERLENNEIENSKINFDSIIVSSNRKIIPVNKVYRNLLKDNNASHYVAFSNIIFNKNVDKAVVYMINNRGPLSGNTILVLLEKKDGSWRVFKRKLLTIS